jgi:hypothetical protein
MNVAGAICSISKENGGEYNVRQNYGIKPTFIKTQWP